MVTLITGGGNGIGAAVAERFLDEGSAVVILDHNRTAIELFRRRHGARADGVCGDVTTWADNVRAVERAIARFGRLDCFIGNAGLFDFFKPLARLYGEDIGPAFDELFAVNVKSYLLGARAARDAIRSAEGSMIFTASNAALHAGGGGPLYVASKHAVLGLTRQLAYELAPLVRVNAVAPGATSGTALSGTGALGHDSRHLDGTAVYDKQLADMTPLGRVPTAADHAGTYVYLASKANSGSVTAAVIPSNGGWEIRPYGKPPESAP